MQLVEQPNGTFTTAELARLAVYRAAVQAGFYTDWDGSASGPDLAERGALPRPDSTSEAEGEAGASAATDAAEDR